MRVCRKHPVASRSWAEALGRLPVLIHAYIAASADALANCNDASHAQKLVLMRPRRSGRRFVRD